ncbi:DUF3231 family protein [Desulfosporosinus sp. PR]|uniref:DUF3231 family protein n=1 Tax=Candidatus Desulfosporosinus nitrosoreducens TaxID=3401928 RepID=UPI0027E6D450|nr:DUF3231 family protein [Desulfosporosinus sp. PR]MDQ7092503.1 DUF3231 family protein [Desulfosporosinus sp. PR]
MIILLTAISRAIEKINSIGKTAKDKQSKISVSEVWHLWDLLVARYDVISETQMLKDFASDFDFKFILESGLDTLKDQVNHLERLMGEYGIPLPEKPPETVTSTVDLEEITDKYIYRRILRGIQDFLNIHLSSVSQATSAIMRGTFIAMLVEEIKIFDGFMEYGKLKGWTYTPPHYK